MSVIEERLAGLGLELPAPCAERFNATPAVINGFSDLILHLWGDAGLHARSSRLG